MKLYLSSYQLGNHTDKLQALVNKSGAKVAVSVNALDNTKLDLRRTRLEGEFEGMRSLGFEPEELDLRDFFDKDSIVEKMQEFDLVWFSGGNVFLLVKAMKQSGFGNVFKELVKTDRLVYAGYSAAFCALSPSLKGMELVDDKDAGAEGYVAGEVWEGYDLIDFCPIVHFRSNHHESDRVEKEYEYVVANNIPHKTFHDGDVYIVEGDEEFVLTALLQTGSLSEAF